MIEVTKQKLISFNIEKGYGITDADIIETILECGEVIWEGTQDRHRWFSMIPTVVKINDILIEYDRCDAHGEMASVDDCIGGYTLDMFKEVRPTIVESVEYIEV